MNGYFLCNESQFLFPNALSCLGDFLVKLAENSLFSVNVRDVKTKQYQLSNAICAGKWGLTPQEMVGLTHYLAMERVPNFSNLKDIFKIIDAHEQEAIKNNQQMDYLLNILTYDGTVSIQKTVSIPVFGTKKQPIAIASVTYDLTRHAHLLYLLKIYKSYYPQKQRAEERISYYLKLTQYLDKPLNSGELKILLAMTQEYRAKRLAKVLQLSPKTIAGYIASLRDKLKPNIDLYSVLSHLRARQQWQPNHGIS